MILLFGSTGQVGYSFLGRAEIVVHKLCTK